MHPFTTSAAAATTVTFSLIATITMLAFSVDVATSSLYSYTFPNCNQTFSYGDLSNIYYPFSGGPRPTYCGLPGFQLSCVDNSTTVNINSLSYRVIELDQINHTLRLSRADLYNSTCTNLLINSTFSNTFFSLVSNNDILSLFYGCSDSVIPVPHKPQNSFICEKNGKKDAYYLFGPIPNYPILSIFECSATITVPILLILVSVLESNRSLLGEVLREGFSAGYSNPYADDCEKCYESGGHCGFDISSGNSLCICDDDRPCPGLGIAAATITSALLGCYYYLSRRPKFLSGKALQLRQMNPKQEEKIEAFIVNYHSLMPKRYSYSDLKKMTNSFGEKLGQGGFGGVYKGQLSDGRPVAVKLLIDSSGDGEEFINEVASISRTSHVNVVTLLGFCYEKTKRALVYEYMPNGSLDKFIYNQSPPYKICHLDRKKLFEIAIGIARGLEYLHRGCNTRIVHFDIKPHNILLDDDFIPKIADFGLAKLCKGKESIMSTLGARGTVGYIAPEVFMRSFGGISYKSDVYSYGMMILEMFGGKNNSDNGELQTSEMYFPDQIYKYLETEQVSIIDDNITDEEEEIVRKMIIVGIWCIQTNPSTRPSMSKVIEMLEGSLQVLQIPPKALLFSAATPIKFSTISSTIDVDSQTNEDEILALTEAESAPD